jgi:hypothetical protein
LRRHRDLRNAFASSLDPQGPPDTAYFDPLSVKMLSNTRIENP